MRNEKENAKYFIIFEKQATKTFDKKKLNYLETSTTKEKKKRDRKKNIISFKQMSKISSDKYTYSNEENEFSKYSG